MARLVASSVAMIYGQLEVAGYLLLSISPVTRSMEVPLAAAGLSLILAAALVESLVIV